MSTYAVHLLVAREPTDRQNVTMARGIVGRTDYGRWGGEFTTMDGRESRLSCAEKQEDTTCRRCLAAVAKKIHA
jgi:hypothetical protein